MRFVDTNIFIYSLDSEPSPPEKTAIAQEIIIGSDIACGL
jgi:predicted nucleic acid-binding protein